MADLIAATWQGPFPGERVDGSTLAPGDVAQVTEADLASGHWARVGRKPAPVKVSEEGDS